MTSRVLAWTISWFLLHVSTVGAESFVRFGGSMGLALTTRRVSDDFHWNLDSSRQDSTLATLKILASPRPGLEVFVRFDARFDAARREEPPRFTLGQASLRYQSDWVSQHQVRLRLFARQPSSVWLDHPLRQPVAAEVIGSQAQGVRGEWNWRNLHTTLLGVHSRGFRFDSRDVLGPDEDFVLGRLRYDVWQAARLRLATTFLRQRPHDLSGETEPSNSAARYRDLYGLDARFSWSGVTYQMQFDQVDAVYRSEAAGRLQEPGIRSTWRARSSRRLTDILPTTAALRLEARAPRLSLGEWGWLGLAPSFRAVGAHHSNPLNAHGRVGERPRRGFEGYRGDVWLGASRRPVWLRQVYERWTEFRDANRRVIRQVSELQWSFHQNWNARAVVLQNKWRTFRDLMPDQNEYHNHAFIDLTGEDTQTRVRLQLAVLDIDGTNEREVLVVESKANITARWQALTRSSLTRQNDRTRGRLFVELQYWHVPEFEFSVSLGADELGDRADPALDAELQTLSEPRQRLLLHFRGWF